MKLVCPECRRENEPERIYCHDCGARLDRSSLAKEKSKEEDPKATQKRLKAMLDPQVSHDALPFFFSDQYDAGMEYVGHVASVAQAQLVVRGELATREFLALWCVDGRVEAGMHLNVWDTIDDVQALIRSRRQLDPARLADTSVALSDI